MSQAAARARQDAYRDRLRMLISCPDRPGIVASVSRFLFERGANVVRSDQYTTDPHGGHFFMRVEFELDGAAERGPAAERDFAAVARDFQMSWRIEYASRVKRLAIFVSREDHCLFELLRQQQGGDLRAEIALVVSNHPDLEPTVRAWGIPYHHVPVTRETRGEAEREQLRLLAGRVDLIVLARYMQILSPGFVDAYPRRIINIHHSFLPAFAGARPYTQAYERGVKLIGATAHYVTADLDQGPIIEQDVQRVDHRAGVAELRRLGRHVERTVLARAVAWHVEDRILVYQNKTIVFD